MVMRFNNDPERLRRLADLEDQYPVRVGGNTCKCGGMGTDPHPCPFAHDIHNDTETLCNCCEECETECAMDI